MPNLLHDFIMSPRQSHTSETRRRVGNIPTYAPNEPFSNKSTSTRRHVTFVDKEGQSHTFEVADGDNLLDIAQGSSLPNPYSSDFTSTIRLLTHLPPSSRPRNGRRMRRLLCLQYLPCDRNLPRDVRPDTRAR